MHTLQKRTARAGFLVSLLFATLAACTPHERFHNRLESQHEDFHRYPYTGAEHRRFHENLEDLHEDYHDRSDYNRRYYDRRY
jgi:hypothetical protein